MQRDHGAIIVDGIEVASTKQCCHCGNHFLSVQGSGIRRGFCTRCMAMTCGNHACDCCMPFEKKLDLFEKGKIFTL